MSQFDNDDDRPRKLPDFRVDDCPPVVGRSGHSGTIKEFKDKLNGLIRGKGWKPLRFYKRKS